MAKAETRKTVPRRPAAERAPAGQPRRDAALKQRVAEILGILRNAHPDARCELDYQSPFQLVIATILSAQCTDERVNQVTPALFRAFPTPQALADAAPEAVEEIIRSTGFFRAKAKSIQGCARALAQHHAGEVPRSMEAMVVLPGVGRKTANVVLGHTYGINEGIAVDTHVLRVSERLGIARGDDPIEVEKQLMALVPRDLWTLVTDLLIFHGRRTCSARRPECGRCPVFAHCRWPERQARALATDAR